MSGRCDVLGFTCFGGTLDAAAAEVLRRLRERAGGYACFCNAHVLVTAHHDEELRESLVDAWMLLADGAPVAWLERRVGAADARRISGPDFMPLLFRLGEPLGIRHYLLGSTPDVLEKLRRRLRARFPAALIVGAGAPRIELDAIAADAGPVEAIAETQPDIVWCGLGAPKQERWMRANHARLAPAMLFGVGAAFDFLAGAKRRAPVVLQQAGLEWLHRLILEPRRLGGRYARTNSEFVVRAARQLLVARP